ncbi:MAG TPA: sterol desaturase family protein [Caulobacteraceae bacterium]|jgi:sterol desaturase/sphingolipid hydroxylase (fatty acid hydroxylase superfamily)|nr:sterol desaturase family protein [Caulobacteraceae bacterium]
MTQLSPSIAEADGSEGLKPERTKRERIGVGGRMAFVLGLVVYVALVGLAWLALSKFLPDQAHVALLGHGLTLRHLHDRIVGNGALAFLLLPTALAIECAAVGWEASSARQLLFDRKASARTDLAFFLLGQGHVMDLVGKVLTLGASMLSGVWIHDRLSALLGFPLTLVPAQVPAPLQVVVYFGVYSFFDYWAHRVDHSRYFWPLHRYHHAAEEFYVLTAGRAHPAAFTGLFLVNVPMAILGASPVAMIYVNVLVITLGFLIHSRIDSNFGWIGRWIVQSPNHHRLHHVLDISTQAVGHFSMAPIWDHLFGTWRGEADQSLVIGVDTDYRHGFWIGPDLIRDYWHFWRGWFSRAPG